MKSLHELLRQVESLADTLHNLSTDLIQTAENLQNPGTPPSETSIERQLVTRKVFVEVQAEVLELARSVGVLPISERDTFTSVRELKSLLQTTAEAEEKRRTIEETRRRALEVLAATLSLVHRDTRDLPSLLQCHARARELHRPIAEAPWTDMPSEVQTLAEGTHPFSVLLTFVKRFEELDDTQWQSLHATIAEAFDQTLVTAALRGKLVFQAEVLSQEPPIALTSHDEHLVSVPFSEPNSLTVTEFSVVSPNEARTAAQSEISFTERDKINTTEDPKLQDLLTEPFPGIEAHRIPEMETSAVPHPADDETLPSVLPSSYQEEQLFKPGDISQPTPSQVESPFPIQVEAQKKEEAEGERSLLSSFGLDDTAQHIATLILNGLAQDRPAALRDFIWRLIYEDKLALAFHTARCAEDLYSDLDLMPPVWLVHAVMVSRHVCHPTGTLAHLLKNDLTQFSEDIFVPGQRDWKHALRFLLVAASLRPTLLTPDNNTSRILHSLRMKEGLHQLWEYSERIATYGEQQNPLDPNALKKVKDQAIWQAEVEALCHQVNAWCAQAPRMTIVYAPATKVWRNWQEPGRLIHSLLMPVRQNDVSQVEEVKQQIGKLSDDAELKRQIDYTDRKVLKRPFGDNITAKALGQLRSHVGEATEFARRWVDLHESRPAQHQRKIYQQQQAAQIRQEVWNRQETVLEELISFAQQHPSLCIMSSVAVCRKAVENIRTLFDPDAVFSAEEPLARHILQADFLRMPRLLLNDDWEPESSEKSFVLDSILDLIATDRFSWVEAFDLQCEARNHDATARIIDYLEAHLTEEIQIDTLRTAREKHLRDCQAALRRDIESTRKQVHDALAFGLLRESEFRSYDSELDNLLLALLETVRFAEKHSHLQSIRQTLNEKRAIDIETARKRLQITSIGPEHPAYAKICHVLDTGDVLTANEYIDMALNGLPLPEGEMQHNAFQEFFPHMCREIEDFMEPAYPPRPDPFKIVTEVREYAKGRRRGYMLGPVNMGPVAGKQAEQAADMLEAWFKVKKAQRIDDSSIRTILTSFGFNPLQVTIDQSGRRRWIEVEAEPIQERTRCSVHAYGSSANGRYRILCVWDRPTEEDILNDMGDASRGRATLVFYFGRVTDQRRRDLARLCRERRRTVLVIDDIVVLYLCGERGSRLPILFACTLPFTWLEPYTTTAGLVPPEMFYGRVIEREAIIDPMGSCFIYGGRQLGKTALLRDVERSFHAPQEGRIALWIDLKNSGIGMERPIDEIWQILITEFKRLEVLPTNLPDHTGADRLFELLREWLNKDARRRILLLLDEADRFLASDGKEEFIRVSRIKGIMDRTNRRFKVLFAGLHNVQRTTKQENHPLAHYGDPLCIGPLLANGEWRAARALVEEPLASLGFQFESPDLVTRILSQTNYYPNLIQLYCTQLLRHITSPTVVTLDAKTGPPYTITSQHVDEAYQSQELRTQIRYRLMLTLQLDRRYEVIAYAIAYRYFLDGERSLVDGFSVSHVREDVLTWWPEGFRTSASEDAIRTLLDEMIGLGVLRPVGTSKYTLRSPNVISLMGTEDEITQVLESSREASIEYEPALFRSAFRTAESVEQFRRSPLTAQQESELRSRRNGVSILLGCRAAGLDELQVFLELTFGKEFLVTFDTFPHRADFARRLADDLSKREKDGVTLILVLPTCPWSESWVSEAVERTQALKSKTRFVRIVFVADPQIMWQLLTPDPPVLDTLVAQGVTLFSLRQWHDVVLRQWLEDCDFGPRDKAGREQITTVTGNWPLLLDYFYQHSKSDPHRWERSLQKLAEDFNRKPFAEDVARALGLDRQEARRVLHDLAMLREASSEDLLTVVEDIPPEVVHQSLRWADLLNLTTRTQNGCWHVDDLVARVLPAFGQ